MDSLVIDINQRIPLAVLETALVAHLTDTYSSQYVAEQLQLEFTGENRIKKGVRIVNKIIPRNPIIQLLEGNNRSVLNSLKSKTDRNLILISLLNSTYTFSFDVLRIFGKYFQAQSVVNSELIRKSISAKYGSNRATHNGLYCVIPMFLEADLFYRTKPKIYEFSEPKSPVFEETKRIYEESFKQNVHNGENISSRSFDPYFTFIG